MGTVARVALAHHESGQHEHGSVQVAHGHRCSSHTSRVVARLQPLVHCGAPCTRSASWTGRRREELVFGVSECSPFSPTTLQERADRAWRAAKLERVTPHALRHTYASFMIAAGANAKALSSYLGHASIQITYDRYGHLVPGNEAEAAMLMDAYLERSSSG